MKKIGWWIVTVFLLSCWLILPVTAEDGTEDAYDETLPSVYAELPDYLPDGLPDLLPDGMFSEDPDEAMAAVAEASDLSYLTSAVLNAVGLRLGDALTLLCTLVGLLLVAGMMRAVRDAVGGKSGELFGFCLRLVIYAAIVGQASGMLSLVTGYFNQLRILTVGMIPVMGALYAVGGNVGQAVRNGEVLTVFMSVIQYVATTLTPPFCGICLSFSLLDAFGSRLKLAPLGALIKKWYTAGLGLIMFLLGTVLSLQSVLTSRADTLAMRSVKYAVGTWIPVVGSAVSGALGTVASVIGSLRGIGGTCGVILVMLLLLPTLVQILLFRWVFGLSATVAEMLGCDSEARLLIEMGSLYGYMAAAVSVSSLVFILALGLLIGTAPALA